MRCPVCRSKLKTTTTKPINDRLIVRYLKCVECGHKVKSTETY